MQAGISVDHVNHAEGIQRVSTGAGTWVRYDGTLPFCAAKLIALALVPSMKLLPLSMLIFSAAASSSFAEGTTVHAFIGTKWMETKANALEVTWSSELEGIEIRDEKVESSSPFLLRCGDDGRQYVMISIPAEDDIWPTVTEDVRATADVMAFGSDLEITGVPLSSMKAGSHRLIFVDLGKRISEFVRHWYSGMSVRVATKPGRGLEDLNFIVAAPLPDAGAREKFAETIALCQIFAR